MPSREHHHVNRLGWLRAAVLGANDGMISTASLILGVAAATSHDAAVVAGFAGLVAGALSMAAGEYVSVSSQADSERADLDREQRALDAEPELELEELTQLQVQRGLPPALARQTAEALTRHDALEAHARDELGLHHLQRAQPLQAAVASAIAFSLGAGFPLTLLVFAPAAMLPWGLFGACIAALGGMGALAARIGGAPAWRGAARVAFWGALAMTVTHFAGWLFGAMG